jgi:uroporphyrinogen decarboxylase
MSEGTPTNDLFLRACRGERTERYPVWMMRQAGRYLAEYRAVRAEADFLTLCRTPELAARVTLQPVDLVDVDAAIVFADILLPLDAMGAGLRFVQGDGPRFERPVRSRSEISGLSRPDVGRELGYVFEALRLVRRELDGRVPLIGFAGTPWTLAAYLVEGGPSKSYAHLLEWSYADPEGLAELLERIADVTIDYLQGQIEAGAQALQLFDTWGGLVSRERWGRLAEPALVRILEAVGDRVPRIYYVNGGHHLLPRTRKLPVEVLSVDWRAPLDEVREMVGKGKALQGNLDPGVLLGPEEQIVTATQRMLERVGAHPHVANLGHGILPMTDPHRARAFVRAVKGFLPPTDKIRALGR